MQLHKNIKLLAWFNFFTDFRLFAPIAIIYFQKITGSFALGMSVFSVTFISAALFEVPTGIFSDKIGRKKTVILGALSTVFALTSYALANTYILLLIGAVLEGLGRSFYSGNNNALLHETLQESKQEHEYHEFLGKTSSMFQIAAAVAALAGGLIAGWSFKLVMWISVIPQILCFLISLKLIEPNVHLKDSGNIFQHLDEAFRNIIHNKKLRILTLANIIGFGMGDAGFEFKAAFYNLVWPTWALGIPRMISNLSGAVSYYFSGKLIDRFTAVKMLLVDSVFAPVVNTLSAVFITVLSPIFMSTTSIFYGVGQVAQNILIQKEFSNEQRATMGSLVSFGGSLFNALSAFTLGVLADKFGIIIALLFSQFVLVMNVYLYRRIYNHSKKQS